MIELRRNLRNGHKARVAFIRSGIRENSGRNLSEVSRLQLRRDRYTFVQCALVLDTAINIDVAIKHLNFDVSKLRQFWNGIQSSCTNGRLCIAASD